MDFPLYQRNQVSSKNTLQYRKAKIKENSFSISYQYVSDLNMIFWAFADDTKTRMNPSESSEFTYYFVQICNHRITELQNCSPGTHLCYSLADKHQSVAYHFLTNGREANSFHFSVDQIQLEGSVSTACAYIKGLGSASLPGSPEE